MKPQHFAALALTALVCLVAAILVYSASVPWTDTTAGGSKLFPSLGSDAPKVALVEIKHGANKLSLEKSGSGWVVKERDGYPADADKIRALFASLTEGKLTEPKTRSPDRYALLEVEDPGPKEANSRLLRLLDDKGGVVAEVIAGQLRELVGGPPAGTYVRKVDDAQAWYMDTNIVGGTELNDWVKTRVYDAPVDKLKKLTVQFKGEQPYEIETTDAGDHKLKDIPAGKKVKYVNAIDNLIDATSYIDFNDVRKAADSLNDADVSILTLEAKNGLKITAKIRGEGDATWIRVAAAGEGDAKKQADDINARALNWEFKILPSKASAILKKRDELLEDSSPS